MGSSRVAVVTCAWHAPRAIEDFRATGLDAWALPSPGVRASALRSMYRRGHELVCTWLDARAMGRAHALVRPLQKAHVGAGRSES
jgi:hypothetical protein